MTTKSLTICLKGIVATIFMLLFQPGHAQYDFSPVDRLLEKYKKEIGPDVVILVSKDDKIILKKETGEMKANVEVPVGDASKWLTAAVVMQTVDEGKLTLDDKVSTYIPIMEKYKKGYITIRNCLNHTTGIETGEVSVNQIKKYNYENLQEEVTTFITKKDIKANPGEEFWYSNIGANMAARVLELQGKNKAFDRIAQEKLFRPLGMRTSFRSDGTSGPNPAGGARSTAIDYMKFLQMLMNKGMFNGKRILSEESVAEMFKSQITFDQVKYAPKAGEGYSYGLGAWLKFDTQDSRKLLVSHSSGLFGPYVMIDHCNGYAMVFMVPNLGSEKKIEFYRDLKRAVDSAIESRCEE